MSQNEKQKFAQVQGYLSPSVTIYRELISNQSNELGLDPKKFWIDNALISTYDYIRMLDYIHLKGVQPSTRQMLKP